MHPDDAVVALTRPTPSYPFGEANDFLFRVRERTGTYRRVRSRSVTTGADDGTPHTKTGVHIDMTDDSLLRLAELSNANDRLRRFAQLAAHDLRSPLRAISALVDFIVEDDGDTLPASVRRRLDQVAERTGRLDQLIEDLLAYSVSRGPRDSTDVDLAAVVSDAVGTVDHRQCRVTCEVRRGTIVTVAAEPLALCLRNLVDNACKHHDKAAGSVRVVAGRDGQELTITVEDDGPGIPESRRAQVFEPFQTTDKQRGSGLGLAMVRREVEAAGGSIAIDTDPGVGTTFRLCWPLNHQTLNHQPPNR